MSMARHHLCVCAALFYFLAFSSPLVAGRLGGRSCHTSFFFPDILINDDNDLRLLTGTDGNEHGASADFRILPFTGSSQVWTEGHGSPLSLIQVRLLNLHKLSLFDPAGVPHALDLSDAWRDTLPIEKLSHGEQPTHGKSLSTWSFSTSNPHHQPIVWIHVHSRRGLWHHEFPDHAEQKPLHLDDGEWQSRVNELWRMACGLLLGAATGMVFAGTVTLVWSLIRRMCAHAQDDEEDVGFLFGYQELPAPEKEGSKGDEKKESAKEGAIVAQNM